MKKILYLILLTSAHIYGQQVKGYIYDQQGRVANFPLLNATQNLYSTSDSHGYFEIMANMGDSVVLRSDLYKPYIIRVSQSHTENEIVIELEPESLEEVVVDSYIIEAEKLGKSLHSSIQNDIKNNPHFYKPSNGNILNLISSLISVFKKKDPSENSAPEERTLQTKDFITLFKEDALLNENFLTKELFLPKTHHLLFMDYLGSKELSYTYLHDERKLDLIDLIYKYNTEYQKIIEFSENRS